MEPGSKRSDVRRAGVATGPLRAVSAMLLVTTPAAADDHCAPRAQVSGDTKAVEQVVVELQRLGVGIGSASPGCPAVEAAVEIEGNGLAVAVRDASHRSEGRVVGDAAIAAAWIDSWLHDGLDPWRDAAPAPVRVAEAPGATPPIGTHVAVEPQRASILDRLSFAADVTQTWTDDNRTIQGIAVAACVEVGAVCIGGRATYGSLDFTSGLTGGTRSDASLLATAGVPLHVGTMRITPELGLGLARTDTTRVDGCKPAMPPCTDPTDPNCNMTGGGSGSGGPNTDPCIDPTTGMTKGTGIYVGDNFEATTYAPRAEIALRVAVPLFPRVWLDGFASVSATLLAHTSAFPAQGVPPGATAADVALPGEPDLGYTLGIGVRVEAP